MKKSAAICALLISLFAHSQQKITNTQDVFNLANNSWFLEDKTGEKTIRDILADPTNESFKKLNKPVCNFGMTASAFWIKCTIRNQTTEKIYLSLSNPTLTDVQLYEFDSSGVLKGRHHSGNWLAFKNWETPDLDYRIPLYAPPNVSETFFLRVQHYRGVQFTLNAGTESALYGLNIPRRMFEMIYYGIIAVMVLYNLFIFLTLKDKAYLYYVIYTFLMGILNAVVNGDTFKYLWPGAPVLNHFIDIISCSVGATSILFAIHFLLTRQNSPMFHKLLRILLGCYFTILLAVVAQRFFMPGYNAAMVFLFAMIAAISFLTVLTLISAGGVVLKKGYEPARFYLVAWSFLLGAVIIFILKDFNLLPYNFFTVKVMEIGSAAEALLLSMALANRINLLKKEKDEAQMQHLLSLEENKKLITEQNKLLERKVEERTRELKQANKELLTAIQNLEETQTQLIQREKMASLGELTAGIAHEIKNPLNFINNFSDVNTELIRELKNELQANNKQGALSLADEIKENQQKINQHGKRADAIVNGMLEHSRGSSGKKEPTDINALADACLRLSYHGLKAKDKSFNAAFKTNFDDSIGKIQLVQQDISRVLLNLYNNAFYACSERSRTAASERSRTASTERIQTAASLPHGDEEKATNHEPTVWVKTSKIPLSEGGGVLISIRDNGPGIPKKIVDKIFQPFFTTKPTGQGTGLGLSLSYDIIKAHGGEIKVETKEDEGTEFIIKLPL